MSAHLIYNEIQNERECRMATVIDAEVYHPDPSGLSPSFPQILGMLAANLQQQNPFWLSPIGSLLIDSGFRGWPSFLNCRQLKRAIPVPGIPMELPEASCNLLIFSPAQPCLLHYTRMQHSISESVSLETCSTTSIIIKYWKIIGKTFSTNSFKTSPLPKFEVPNQSPKYFEVTLTHMTRLI